MKGDATLGLILMAVFTAGLWLGVVIQQVEGGQLSGQKGLLELQIEEKQLKIKQLKSGACINE